jgi:hypothetical protein
MRQFYSKLLAWLTGALIVLISALFALLGNLRAP